MHLDIPGFPESHGRVPAPEPDRDELPIRAGSRFTTVLLGLPLGDRISLFHDNGKITTHRLPSGADLADRLGRGSVARADVGEGFRREAALWDEASSFLLVSSRYGEGNSVPAGGFQLSQAEPTDESGEAAEAAGVHLFLIEVAKAAVAANEAVYLSRGGWAPPPNEQYALFVATRSASGVRLSHLETFPHPEEGSLWDLFQNRTEGKAVMVTSPLDAGMDGVGPLLFAAASGFCPPRELALSFLPVMTGGSGAS